MTLWTQFLVRDEMLAFGFKGLEVGALGGEVGFAQILLVVDRILEYLKPLREWYPLNPLNKSLCIFINFFFVGYYSEVNVYVVYS